MALVSPGVEVTIIDQSQYLPAAQNSVPLVVLATAQNKANAAGDGVATATTAANANKLYLVTSQRDLVNLYGTPFFYTTTNGTPIQGYELNEYAPGLNAMSNILAQEAKMKTAPAASTETKKDSSTNALGNALTQTPKADAKAKAKAISARNKAKASR